MKCSLGISNFLEEISSFSHAIVFLYLFVLIAKEGFISPCCSLELCIQNDISFLFSFAFGEGNGNPLQCSWLENPRDSGAWWAAVYGVAQSRTQLKWLSSSSSKAAYSSFGPLLFILLNAAPHLSSLPVTLYCCTLYIWTLTSNISISIDHDH